jgi:MSHA biogenesis protein MshN
LAWFARRTDAHVEDDPQARADARIARRERIERLRRGSVWYLAVMLLAVLIGLMIGRVVNGQIPWGGVPPTRGAPSLQVMVDDEAGALRLQLVSERPLEYRRVEAPGAVSLVLADARLSGEPRSGRVTGPDGSLSWRLEPRGGDVHVLLVGLGEGLRVLDQAQPSADDWRLVIEARMARP